MENNRYRSFEDGYKNAWLKLVSGERLEIRGDTYFGYHIVKRGRVGSKLKVTWNSLEIYCGEHGSHFAKKKDAENFALVLAMYFNGDLDNQALLKPEFFHGYSKKNFASNSQRNRLFWQDVTLINPQDGWDFFDFSVLDKIPSEFIFSYPCDEETGDALDDRYYGMEEFLECFTTEREQHLFTPNLEDELHVSISKFLAENDDINLAQELRGYASLIMINYYRNLLPFDWIFPNQQQYFISFIPKLLSNLPAFVFKHLELMNAQ